jgi:hypothetical protein
LLVAGLTIGNEAHVNEGLKLNISGGLESMKVKLEWVGISLASNLNHIVEVAFRVGLKLHIKFDGQTGSHVTDVFIVATEV